MKSRRKTYQGRREIQREFTLRRRAEQLSEMQAQMASFKESHHFYSAGCASKRAKGVTRIRIYFPRFWRGNATIVRDCCHDRARLGCSKRRACLRSLPACGFADQRVLNCKAASGRTWSDNRSRAQLHATSCNRIRG